MYLLYFSRFVPLSLSGVLLNKNKNPERVSSRCCVIYSTNTLNRVRELLIVMEPTDETVLVARLKQTRKGLKSTFTKLENELRGLMSEDAHDAVINHKCDELRYAFDNFCYGHREYHDLLSDRADVVQSTEYFKAVEARYFEIKQFVERWHRARNKLRPADADDDVNPSDSVSQTASCTSSAARAAAKRASLMAEKAALSQKQALALEHMRLEQKREELELSTKIAMAEAEEIVYARYDERSKGTDILENNQLVGEDNQQTGEKNVVRSTEDKSGQHIQDQQTRKPPEITTNAPQFVPRQPNSEG